MTSSPRPTAKIDPLSPIGIAAAAMTPKQRELLMKLIDVYTSQMSAGPRAPSDWRTSRRLAWRRSASPGPDRSNLVRSTTTACRDPTFLIEFDNTQNNGNHIHAVWRDFAGDYGRDLLREHLAAVRH